MMAVNVLCVEVLSLPEYYWSSTLSWPWKTFGTNAKLCCDVILSHHILLATIHKLLLLYNHIKFQFSWTFFDTELQSTWSNFITNLKRLYTENIYILLCLKYTKKNSEVTSDAQANGVDIACIVCIIFGIILTRSCMLWKFRLNAWSLTSYCQA
jgi:hypothetical protein